MLHVYDILVVAATSKRRCQYIAWLPLGDIFFFGGEVRYLKSRYLEKEYKIGATLSILHFLAKEICYFLFIYEENSVHRCLRRGIHTTGACSPYCGGRPKVFENVQPKEINEKSVSMQPCGPLVSHKSQADPMCRNPK